MAAAYDHGTTQDNPLTIAIPADCIRTPIIVASSSENHRLAPFAENDYKPENDDDNAENDDDNQYYLFAPGIITSAPGSTPTGCPSHDIPCEGTGISAGQVSGLVAYFLSLSAQLHDRLLGYDIYPDNNNFIDGLRWKRMRTLLYMLSYFRPQAQVTDGEPAVKEIWNGFREYCYWGVGVKARDGTGLECTRPSSSTSTISTIPTHHAPNNNGSSTLTTSSILINSSGVLTTLRTSVSTCVWLTF